MPPRFKHGGNQFGANACGRVDLQVVGPEGVDAVHLEMGASFADPSVAALPFAAVDLLDGAVHADQVYIQAVEQVREMSPPCRKLDDVVNYEVVASCSKRREAAVKACEEARTHFVPPVELSAAFPPAGQETSGELIGGDTQERLIERVLQRGGQR